MADTPVSKEPLILIANDQEWAARSLESILAAEGYKVLQAYTGGQAIERAIANQPDAIILDVQMPDLDGIQVCRTLRAHPLFGATTPMFITTAGPAGRQERLNAYRAGAWEFFGQPLDGETILLKLRLYLEAKSVVDTLRSDSLVDPISGLYNRQGLLRRGRELAAEAARWHRPISCVVFAPEAPGLQTAVASAERLAQRIGDFFRETGRSADAIGRVGLLEFGVITIGTGEAEARQMVRRFNDVAADSPLKDHLGVPRFVFRAACCAVQNPSEEAANPESMLSQAALAVQGQGSEPVIRAAAS